MRRSRAREAALQLLFQFDFNSTIERSVLDQFLHDRLRDAESEKFGRELVDGVMLNRDAIDVQLAQLAENWRIPRMAAVDRNVLRLGAYELLFRPDIPVAVSINEAIELARRFGGKDSPVFVNGILDKVAQLAQVKQARAPGDLSAACSPPTALA